MMQGYAYTIEVLIAVSLVLVATVSLFATPEILPDFKLASMKQQGMETLRYLDYHDNLRVAVAKDAESIIETDLKRILSPSVDLEIDICSATCSQDGVPTGVQIISVDYYIWSYQDTFVGKKVRLYMWEKF